MWFCAKFYLMVVFIDDSNSAFPKPKPIPFSIPANVRTLTLGFSCRALEISSAVSFAQRRRTLDYSASKLIMWSAARRALLQTCTCVMLRGNHWTQRQK